MAIPEEIINEIKYKNDIETDVKVLNDRDSIRLANNYAQDFSKEFQTRLSEGLECAYLDEAIAPLMENRLVTDAFDLVGMVFAEAMSQEIDDSDGGLSFVASICQLTHSQGQHQKQLILHSHQCRSMKKCLRY